MGAVYLGRNRELGSPVAVKVLPLAGGETESGLARFKREARLAANLSHPNIVPVFDFDIRQGMAYLVMPFVVGETLAQVLERQGGFSVPELQELLEQVGAALAFAHRQGVVHRDIKPANLMREDATNRWLVTDFGIARMARPDAGEQTETGVALGTPAYMAPEQWTGSRDVDGRADLYSLARVACEALIGKRTDPPANASGAASALVGSRPDLDPAIIAVLVSPLADDRDRRPASVDVWLKSLRRRPRSLRFSPLAVLPALAAVGVLLLYLALRSPTAALPAANNASELVLLGAFGSDTTPVAQDLATSITDEFAHQLRWIPALIVIGPGASTLGADGSDNDPLDTATVTGTITALGLDSIRIEAEVRRSTDRGGAQRLSSVGAIDSAAVLVWTLVRDAFAPRMGGELPPLPIGQETWRAWHEGVRAFRRGAYEVAVDRFEEVIRRQPTFALAHFKRMLAEVMRAAPTRAGAAVHSALEAARQYRTGLDPASQELLEGYEILLTEGDLRVALEKFEQVRQRHPDVVDAVFIKGFLELNFAALLSRPRHRAERDLRRAYELDPGFAAAVAHLARLAVLAEDDAAGRRYLGEYLRLDSTSVWAEVARMADSLLYRGSSAQIAVLRSLDERETASLEYLALSAGELRQRKTYREFALNAVAALGRVAATRHERVVALRIELATALGAGREATADSLLTAAQWDEAARDERARWIFLAAVTGIAQFTEVPDRAMAERLLATQDDDGTNAWLVARWARDSDPQLAQSARGRLDSLRATPLVRSLRDDLDALARLEVGDTLAALDAWRLGLSRYSIERVVFGLAASLWPLRLEAARTAAAHGDQVSVLGATEAFEQMAGFVDQVAWPEILPLRVRALAAAGHRGPARELSDLLLNLLGDANGRYVALRDSLREARPQTTP
jgi:serine/threonine-protein kinase